MWGWRFFAEPTNNTARRLRKGGRWLKAPVPSGQSMFRYAHSIDANERLHYDLCIIGAGAAGITIARKFLNSGHSVALLEGGDFEISKRSQDIYNGISDGYADLSTARLRYFGGTTNHWAGYCRPPTAAEFKNRDWIPETKWPLSLQDFSSYYDGATQIVEIPNEFDIATWAKKLKTTPLTFETPGLEQGVTVLSPPVRFGTKYRDEIGSSKAVTCFLNANVREFVPAEHGNAIESVNIRRFDGADIKLAAKFFVLACGGIENPRLLLNSNNMFSNGIGNRSDMVGRFFADHRVVRAGRALISYGKAEIFRRDSWRTGKNKIVPYLRQNISQDTSTIGCILGLNLSRQSNSIIARFERKLSRAIGQGVDEYEIHAYAEPIPNRSNRIILTDRRDSLGLRQIKLTYSYSALEKEAILAAIEKLAIALGSAGAGHAQATLHENDADAFVNWGYHHYGTTRMSDNRSNGVVDRDLRVHDMANLYIAGTSVLRSPLSSVFKSSLLTFSLSIHISYFTSA